MTFPGRNIALIARRDAGGTTFAFTGALAAMDPDWEATGPGVSTRPAWPPYTMTANGNEGVSSRLAITNYAIGYIEFGFARRLNLPMALIENRTGAFVAPRAGTGSVALAATAAAMPVDGRQVNFDPESPDAYPIVTYSFVLLPRNRAEPAVTEAMVGFFDFALSAEGQGVAEQIGYVPLPVPVAERARALLATVR
ncbi:MAG: extracellular solute-binding protein [Rhodospirillales bacterium]|nr:MAG: extracellular solute-binding protein [Rhodospirillales bacterium]